MSISWQELAETIAEMSQDEKNGDVHVKIGNEPSLYPVGDIKVAEKSLNDGEPSVIFLTI